MTPGIKEIKKGMEEKYGFNGGTTTKEINFFMIHKLDSMDDKIGDIDKKIGNQVTFCKTHLSEKSKFSQFVYKSITGIIAFIAICVSIYAAIK